MLLVVGCIFYGFQIFLVVSFYKLEAKKAEEEMKELKAEFNKVSKERKLLESNIQKEVLELCAANLTEDQKQTLKEKISSIIATTANPQKTEVDPDEEDTNM
eukprot:TRINITY_DN24876_c0_g1_i1.p1 TRINITY_DN24876_c0_g1~~TRINITY_DN24876_c0_g1_i1.p1  ORF type:complete len:102 (-),score=21.32 TRINITY_DN24876_c0_g1_i1:7-312(-)